MQCTRIIYRSLHTPRLVGDVLQLKACGVAWDSARSSYHASQIISIGL